jgi:hypothetical protein
MAEQSIRDRIPVNRPDDASFNAAWLRLRQELEARLAARFGAASGDQDDAEADPDILADMALERALMS